MAQTKSTIKNSKLFYMYVALVFYVVGMPRSLFELIPNDLEPI